MIYVNLNKNNNLKLFSFTAKKSRFVITRRDNLSLKSGHKYRPDEDDEKAHRCDEFNHYTVKLL